MHIIVYLLEKKKQQANKQKTRVRFVFFSTCSRCFTTQQLENGGMRKGTKSWTFSAAKVSAVLGAIFGAISDHYFTDSVLLPRFQNRKPNFILGLFNEFLPLLRRKKSGAEGWIHRFFESFALLMMPAFISGPGYGQLRKHCSDCKLGSRRDGRLIMGELSSCTQGQAPWRPLPGLVTFCSMACIPSVPSLCSALLLSISEAHGQGSSVMRLGK